MAEENQAVAPVEAPAEAPKSEATSTEPVQQAPVAQQTAPNPNTITITDEQRKFFESNGGLDKIFEKYKSAIANPQQQAQPQQPVQAQQPQQPVQPQQQPVQQPQPQPQQQTNKGSLSLRDIAIKHYFTELANEEQYAGIKDEITSGRIFHGMADLGVNPFEANGDVNDSKIRKYLNLRADTVPAQPTNAPTASSAPTVDYVDVGENVSNIEDAMKVYGQAGHDKHDEALKFIGDFINKGGKL